MKTHASPGRLGVKLRWIAICSVAAVLALAQNTTTFQANSGTQVTTIVLQHHAPSVAGDADGNGLPDAWEIQYFGHAGNDPASDPDKLGRTLLQSYQQGLSPVRLKRFSFQALFPPSGFMVGSIKGVNDSGQVVGNCVSLDYSRTIQGIWTDGVFQTIPPPQGISRLYAEGINKNGDVTGTAEISPPTGQSAYTYHAFLRAKLGTFTDISTTASSTFGYGINDSANVVGSGGSTGGFLWHPASAGIPAGYVSIPLPPSASSVVANAINNQGVVVGQAQQGNAQRPFIYYNNVSTYLAAGGLPYFINNRNEALGRDSSYSFPVFWKSDGTLQSLALLAEVYDGWPGGINDQGEAVGSGSTDNDDIPMFWKTPEAMPVDLNTIAVLPAEWKLTDAEAMSPNGTIAGFAYRSSDQEYYGFVLTPLPLIAVDANRDGVIKLASEDDTDATSSTSRYRFWLNDDDDEGYGPEFPWSDPDPEHYPARRADSNDQIINSERDCEDLTRIWISSTELIDIVKDPASDLYLGLKWKNTNGTHPGIRLFRSADPSGGLGHIKDATIAASQSVIDLSATPHLGTCLGDADAHQEVFPSAANPWVGITQIEPIVRAADFIFRKDTLSEIFGNHSPSYLLFEGVQEGKGELMLVIVRKKSDGTWERVSDGGSVWLQLDNIRRMYVRAHSLPLQAEFPHPWQVDSPPASPYEESAAPADEKALSIPPARLSYAAGDSEENIAQYPFVPTAGEQNKCILFVHGIDLTVAAQQGYAQSFYKRLWWQGYQGRLIAFRWCTPLSSDGLWGFNANDENTSIYNSGEYRAFKGGTSLRKYIEALRNPQSPLFFSTNGILSIAAHSQGNIVAGEALRQGAQVDSYVALEPAVPLACYYPTGTSIPTLPRLVAAEAAHPTPESVQMFGGYSNFFEAIGNAQRTVYFNQNDFWLATGTTSFGLETNWVGNNANFKPDNPFGPAQYTFDYLEDSRFRRTGIPSRLVVDPHETMAFVARARSSALGAIQDAQPLTPTSFQGVSLENIYQFDTRRADHSGQFQRNIQLMYGNELGASWSVPLYQALMRDLGVQ